MQHFSITVKKLVGVAVWIFFFFNGKLRHGNDFGCL